MRRSSSKMKRRLDAFVRASRRGVRGAQCHLLTGSNRDGNAPPWEEQAAEKCCPKCTRRNARKYRTVIFMAAGGRVEFAGGASYRVSKDLWRFRRFLGQCPE